LQQFLIFLQDFFVVSLGEVMAAQALLILLPLQHFGLETLVVSLPKFKFVRIKKVMSKFILFFYFIYVSPFGVYQ
jgi:hypothetical protein